MRKIPAFFVFVISAALLAGAGGFWFGLGRTPGEKLAIGNKPPGETATHRADFMNADFYEAFYRNAPASQSVSEKVVSGVIPHHLVAGKYLASYFTALKNQHPQVVVLFGPNHPQAGRNNFVTSLYDWRTPYGTLAANQDIIQKCIAANLVVADEKIIAAEHTIGAPVAFIKKTWPRATLIPVIIKDRATPEQVQALANKLHDILPEKSLMLASVDFSHYLPEYVADFHDALAKNVLAAGAASRAAKLEIDSPPSIALLLEYNQLKKAQKFYEVFHSNSAGIMGKPDLVETTSHILGYFTASPRLGGVGVGEADEWPIGSNDAISIPPVAHTPLPPSQGGIAATPLLTLQFFGDIMLDRNVVKAIGDQGLGYVFQNLEGKEKRFFNGVDFFIANLEGPFAPVRVPTSKSIAFRFDPAFVSDLKPYHFSGFNLANNHAYDMGRANVVFTRGLLEKNGFGYFGDELNEGPEYTWVAGGVAFLGIHNTYRDPDLAKVGAALVDAKSRARYVIVNVHWGEEYQRASNPKQRRLAHWLIDHGADAIIGHHPHVVQEMEIYKDKPIFYSLGNFIFDQYFSKDTQEGLSVGLTVQAGKVKTIHLFPFYGVKSQVQLMVGERRGQFLDWIEKSSRLSDYKIQEGGIHF